MCSNKRIHWVKQCSGCETRSDWWNTEILQWRKTTCSDVTCPRIAVVYISTCWRKSINFSYFSRSTSWNIDLSVSYFLTLLNWRFVLKIEVNCIKNVGINKLSFTSVSENLLIWRKKWVILTFQIFFIFGR